MEPFDLKKAVIAHPWAAVALAFAAGAGIALGERSQRSLVRATSLALGGALAAALREVAARGLAKQARSWLDARERPYAGATPAQA